MEDELSLVIRVVVAVCALIPFIVFSVSYLRTRMTRLLFAALGFGVFFVKQILLAAGIFTLVVNPNPHTPETTHASLTLLEGIIDLAIVLLFLLALLWKKGAQSDGETGAGDKKEIV